MDFDACAQKVLVTNVEFFSDNIKELIHRKCKWQVKAVKLINKDASVGLMSGVHPCEKCSCMSRFPFLIGKAICC